MSEFDPTKPVQTRDGRAARIIATDVRGGSYPIAALVADEDGDESLQGYTVTGKYLASTRGKHEMDLVPAPDRQVTYRTFSSNGSTGHHGLGGLVNDTYAEAAALISRQSGWEGVVRLTHEDGRLTAVDLVTA